MMRISFSPQRRDETLLLEKSGDTLTINDTPIDFSEIPDGATVPEAHQFHDMLTGDIHRVNGEIHVTVILPHGPDAPRSVLFPEPITVTDDGAIDLD